MYQNATTSTHTTSTYLPQRQARIIQPARRVAPAIAHPIAAAPPAAEWHPTILQRIALGIVWLSIALSSIVFTEPAPVDLATLMLIVVLPLVGLTATPGPLWIVLSVWLACAAGGFVSCAQSLDPDRSSTHIGISLFMYAGFFTFATFVARRPYAHTRLILDAYTWAAVLAACAGVVGYFHLVPHAEELFTRFDRATGTFKDPNVYAPFLGPAILYALHRILNDKGARVVMSAAVLMVLSLGLLISFSRGAWFNTAVAIAIYTYGAIVLADSERQQARVIMLATLTVGVVAALLVVAAQLDGVGELLSSRAAVTQSYDVGPEGRFGGHFQAMGLILEHPLGLGALQFGMHYHHEDVHNVYLSMFLNAGWVGGMIWAVLMTVTVLCGAWHFIRRTPTQQLFWIAYAAFIGNVLEGFVVDTDHWRHLYLLMAIVWGLIASERATSIARDWCRGAWPATATAVA